MKTNFSLLFYLKKQKNYVSGNVPIYMRITVEGNRAEMAANRDCDPKRWNAKGGRAIGSKEEIKVLNTHLDQLQNAMYMPINVFSIWGCRLQQMQLNPVTLIPSPILIPYWKRLPTIT